MMHFRKKSSSSGDSNGSNHGQLHNVKLSKEDEGKLKIRTASVADPILEAVQEAQPFEQAADHDPNRKSYFSSLDGSQQIMRDVFGQPIQTPDISNPTRARDERPLDTIRSFEYAVSGDPSWANQLETAQYGFRVRPDFPLMTTNPYGMDAGAGAAAQPVYAEQAVYQAPASGEAASGEKKKKKKRGLFHRKKKDN